MTTVFIRVVCDAHVLYRFSGLQRAGVCSIEGYVVHHPVMC